MKNTNRNRAIINKNDTKADKQSTEPEQKTPKYNIKKPTDKTRTGTQRQPSTPKLNGMILANQRIDRLKKTTYSKQTTDNNTNDEEYKMEEDDAHTTNNAKDNIDDVTITPTQKIGKLQQIEKSQHTTDDNTNNQEQKKEILDTKPTTSTQPYQLIYIDDTVTVLPLTVQNQHFIGPLTELMTHTAESSKSPHHK